jgi:hypothetical protein
MDGWMDGWIGWIGRQIMKNSKNQRLSISLSIYGSAILLLDLSRFFSFLILYTVYRTPYTGNQPVARTLPAHKSTQTQNKHAQTSMLSLGFEPTNPAFERAKTVYALDSAAAVIGKQ